MARPMYCFLYILGRIVMVYNPFLTIPYQSVIKATLQEWCRQAAAQSHDRNAPLSFVPRRDEGLASIRSPDSFAKQWSQASLVVLPAAHRALIDRLAHLRDAGRAHGSIAFLKYQAGRLPTGVVLPTVTVQVQDAYGNVITSDNSDLVTLGQRLSTFQASEHLIPDPGSGQSGRRAGRRRDWRNRLAASGRAGRRS